MRRGLSIVVMLLGVGLYAVAGGRDGADVDGIRGADNAGREEASVSVARAGSSGLREEASVNGRRGGDAGAVHFEPIAVYVDPKGRPLGAYQFELTTTRGSVQVVGLENGEHAAFDDPPYYDRRAVDAGRADRLIVADFRADLSADELPTRRVRVATVHVMVTSRIDPVYQVKLMAAADEAGRPIDADVTFERDAEQ